MIKALILSIILSGCASNYYNSAVVSASYCHGTYSLTCELNIK